MLLIACPNCGKRPETEFRCGGQAHIARPADPMTVDDGGWSEHLFVRANPKGVHAERWCHIHGCGRWFNALRDTISDRFIETYPIGEQPKSGVKPGTILGTSSATQSEARA
ncbi:sarcosine oxidase subunit delta [Methylobacterium sp. R2-1]|uniref:sarcosine oxidase subunit delta n=1 Tax=Methylobacterium sp. R2-1 TaxID=2587064 RepID=UPI001621DB91|nr:sarcosine oxidase subunit delta [Methylobacterium sp. R2-1]MBB2963447.1 sarcosine oxidase subunit delta [Methylobacterium sp. R2-1]